jgi:hypothetical protein
VVRFYDKKILAIVVVGLLLCGNAFAESKLLETYRFKYNPKISTVCIEGYKFVITYDYDVKGHPGNESVTTSVNTIQFMIVENGVMVPAKC